MQLRAVQTIQSTGGTYRPGDIFFIKDEDAKALIERGAAVGVSRKIKLNINSGEKK